MERESAANIELLVPLGVSRFDEIIATVLFTISKCHAHKTHTIAKPVMIFRDAEAFPSGIRRQVVLVIWLVILQILTNQRAVYWQPLRKVVTNETIDVVLVPEILAGWQLHKHFLDSLFMRHLLVVEVATEANHFVGELRKFLDSSAPPIQAYLDAWSILLR